jgi:hypothetical protein
MTVLCCVGAADSQSQVSGDIQRPETTKKQSVEATAARI